MEGAWTMLVGLETKVIDEYSEFGWKKERTRVHGNKVFLERLFNNHRDKDYKKTYTGLTLSSDAFVPEIDRNLYLQFPSDGDGRLKATNTILCQRFKDNWNPSHYSYKLNAFLNQYKIVCELLQPRNVIGVKQNITDFDRTCPKCESKNGPMMWLGSVEKNAITNKHGKKDDTCKWQCLEKECGFIDYALPEQYSIYAPLEYFNPKNATNLNEDLQIPVKWKLWMRTEKWRKWLKERTAQQKLF